MRNHGPDFIGIGMQKSGTTFAYKALSAHPDILFPAHPARFPFLAEPVVDGVALNTLPKEVQFLHGPMKGIGWDRYLSIFADKTPGVAAGEISPAYAEASFDRISELRRRCPDIRLFAILRDPVDRDWSAIRMIAARQGVLGDPAALRKIARFEQVRVMGDYGAALRRWLSIFPREAFLFLTNDQLAVRPKELLGELCVHIGVEPARLPAPPAERVFEGPSLSCPADIFEDLAARHCETVRETQTLTSLDLSSWLVPDRRAGAA